MTEPTPAHVVPRWGPLVDLHSHVLPGVDDGAPDLDYALRMLRIAEAEGITTIAATPHINRCPPDQIEPAVERLNQAARDAGLNILVVPGSEDRFTPELLDRMQAGRLVTLNHTAYLLVESSLTGEFPPNLRQVIYDLQLAGVWPVLAHPERYPPVQRDPDVLLDLINAGVLMQINADSLAGGHRHGRARHTAELLLRRRMGHLIASDAHNTGSRPPRLQAALTRAAELTDPDYVAWMVDTAAAILRGDPVDPPEPLPAPHVGWLARQLRR